MTKGAFMSARIRRRFVGNGKPAPRSSSTGRGEQSTAISRTGKSALLHERLLPRGWFGAPYRIGDWWSYGLQRPPGGHDWVRVGPDMLLVDTTTGQIAQVERRMFR